MTPSEFMMDGSWSVCIDLTFVVWVRNVFAEMFEKQVVD